MCKNDFSRYEWQYAARYEVRRYILYPTHLLASLPSLSGRGKAVDCCEEQGGIDDVDGQAHEAVVLDLKDEHVAY